MSKSLSSSSSSSLSNASTYDWEDETSSFDMISSPSSSSSSSSLVIVNNDEYCFPDMETTSRGSDGIPTTRSASLSSPPSSSHHPHEQHHHHHQQEASREQEEEQAVVEEEDENLASEQFNNLEVKVTKVDIDDDDVTSLLQSVQPLSSSSLLPPRKDSVPVQVLLLVDHLRYLTKLYSKDDDSFNGNDDDNTDQRHYDGLEEEDFDEEGNVYNIHNNEGKDDDQLKNNNPKLLWLEKVQQKIMKLMKDFPLIKSIQIDACRAITTTLLAITSLHHQHQYYIGWIESGVVLLQYVIEALNRFANDISLVSSAMEALRALSSLAKVRQQVHLMEKDSSFSLSLLSKGGGGGGGDVVFGTIRRIMTLYRMSIPIQRDGCAFLSNCSIIDIPNNIVASVPWEHLSLVVEAMKAHKNDISVMTTGYLALQNFTLEPINCQLLVTNEIEVLEELLGLAFDDDDDDDDGNMLHGLLSHHTSVIEIMDRLDCCSSSDSIMVRKRKQWEIVYQFPVRHDGGNNDIEFPPPTLTVSDGDRDGMVPPVTPPGVVIPTTSDRELFSAWARTESPTNHDSSLHLQLKEEKETVFVFSAINGDAASVPVSMQAIKGNNADIQGQLPKRVSTPNKQTPPAKPAPEKSPTLFDPLTHPPYHLLHTKGGLEGAFTEAVATQRLLVVNIQQYSQCFGSFAINRDIWADTLIQNIVQSSFLFFQTTNDTRDGSAYIQHFSATRRAYPYVAILNPRTRRVLWSRDDWSAERPWSPERIAESMMDICSRYEDAFQREVIEVVSGERSDSQDKELEGTTTSASNKVTREEEEYDNTFAVPPMIHVSSEFQVQQSMYAEYADHRGVKDITEFYELQEALLLSQQ